MLRISIIIPVFNSASTLRECLVCLTQQLRPDDEIVVVDNNSTDDSLDIAKSFPAVTIAREPRQGAYLARNLGCHQSTGEIIAFTDPDCIPCHNWISLIDEAFSDQKTTFILGRQQFAKRSLALDLAADYEKEKVSYIYGSTDPSVYFCYCNNMALRRSLWGEVGPFVERRRGSDVILIRRAIDRHSPAITRYIPAMTVKHTEITGLLVYYRKMKIYGRSRRNYRNVVLARSLNNPERLKIFCRTKRSNQYSLLRTIGLFFVLLGGWLSWSIGTLSSILEKTEKGSA